MLNQVNSTETQESKSACAHPDTIVRTYSYHTGSSKYGRMANGAGLFCVHCRAWLGPADPFNKIDPNR